MTILLSELAPLLIELAPALILPTCRCFLTLLVATILITGRRIVASPLRADGALAPGRQSFPLVVSGDSMSYH